MAKIGLLVLLPALVAGDACAAPAPVPRNAPPPGPPPWVPRGIYDVLNGIDREMMPLVADYKRYLARSTDEAERERYRRTIAKWTKAYYCDPIIILKNALKDKNYQDKRTQQWLKTALDGYQIRYERAKKQGLVK